MFKKIVGQLWKVATGYIVFCVASIQLISVLSDNIEFEETLGFSSAAIIQFTFFAAPIGLPLILIFALAPSENDLKKRLFTMYLSVSKTPITPMPSEYSDEVSYN